MKRAAEFAMARDAGQSEAGRFLILNTVPLPAEKGQACPSLFGIITTKRVGHAVVRNRMRRLVREILRKHGEPLSLGLYVVLVVRNRATMTDYQGLEKDFLKLLARQQKKASAAC